MHYFVHKNLKNLSDETDKYLRNITVQRQTDNGTKEWFEVTEVCTDPNYLAYLSKIPYHNCSYVMMYTFNDKIFPSTLNFITAGG